MKKILFFLFLSSTARAEFFCNEEAGQLRGSTYVACGIGESPSEGRARAYAFTDAKREFNDFCTSSSSCKDHEVDLNPKRNVCVRSKLGFYTCYRLVTFTIR